MTRIKLVPFPLNIDMFRATQRRQDKARPAENGAPLSRAATPYWRRCVAPCGRAGKRSPAALHRLARARHSLRGAPCAQPLPDPLNMSILSGKGTSSSSTSYCQAAISVKQYQGVSGVSGTDLNLSPAVEGLPTPHTYIIYSYI